MQADTVVATTAEEAPNRVWWRWDARPVWQSAVAAWVGQRLLVGALVAAWQTLLLTFAPEQFLHIWNVYQGGQYTSITLFGHRIAPQLAYFYRVWTLFDGIWFTSIARYGYRIVPQAAYSPLYPLLIRLTTPLAGGHITLAGLLVANACSLGAFVILGRLVERQFGAPVARRTLFYYAIFPTGLFFASEFTEGLFLLLSVAAFLLMRQRRWTLSGALIALAALTRSQGMLLLAPLTIEAGVWLWREWREWAHTQRLRAALALSGAFALPLAAYFGFDLYLAWQYAMPNVAVRALTYTTWRRYLDWPWVGVTNNFVTLVTGGPSAPRLEVLTDFVFLAFWLGACIVMLLPVRLKLPRLPASWIGYSWLSLAPSLLLPAHIPGGGLMSISRYALVVFPCLVLMALLGNRYPRAHRLMVALCIAWMIILTRLVASELFVA
ncbi:MAG TPA: glycosyltransferase family 39 protein [Ktedonobacterales bacterium]